MSSTQFATPIPLPLVWGLSEANDNAKLSAVVPADDCATLLSLDLWISLYHVACEVTPLPCPANMPARAWVYTVDLEYLLNLMKDGVPLPQIAPALLV